MHHGGSVIGPDGKEHGLVDMGAECCDGVRRRRDDVYARQGHQP
jgi:hypothetical protein